jgi:hypothetical protein
VSRYRRNGSGLGVRQTPRWTSPKGLEHWAPGEVRLHDIQLEAVPRNDRADDLVVPKIGNRRKSDSSNEAPNVNGYCRAASWSPSFSLLTGART